ncbi:MAG TPA: adenylate/guanylate cyclase domain-containing protein, partial [Spirochaetota bacterium]|nr:adenylate/guanylate cyclase domain-containing protein [Spirochaetota bacterium]
MKNLIKNIFASNNNKKKLTRSLFFYDVITFIFVFISVFIVFESIIKKIFVDFSTDRFSIHYTSLDFDMSVAFDSLEEKTSLDYEKLSNECIKYLVRSYLLKAKYDNSLIFFLFSDSKIISGKKNQIDYSIVDKNINFEAFSKLDQNKLHKFTVAGTKYIGIVRKSKIGVRENRDRYASKLDYPIIVLAEREKDFFFIIDLTRWFFIAWVFIILGVIAYFKIRLTEKASTQIKNISSMLQDESRNIRTRGIIGESLRRTETDFFEVFTLNESSLDLNSALSDLKRIVMGVTNSEFFTGVITNDKSVTEQHKAYCAVMFLDIKGFTSISEKHNEHSMKIGIHIFSSASNILKKYGGEIRKLLGDAALITFKRYSNTQGVVAFNALSAAIEILESVNSVNKELNKLYNPENKDNLMIDYNFRVGLDVGEINEGLYGTPENFEYGIIGDTDNTASRFE